MNVFLQTSLVLTLFLFSAVECGIGDAAESISGGNYELPKASAELFQQQKDRIDFLEASLKAVAFALTKQNNKVFASVVGELKKDPYVSSLLSSATDYKPTSSKNRVEVTTGHQNYTNAAVSKVKWALKCSQPELFDIKSNVSINTDKPMEPEATASSIKASLNQLDYTVSISWKVPTDECAKYVSSLWVKIYESGNPGAASLAQYLTVPISCLKKNPDKSLSLVVHSNSTDGVFSQEKEECQLSSGAYLSECHAYTVELVPNYQSLKGNALLSEIVVPPRLVNRTNMESITSVHIQSGSLVLHWLDNSGCSNKLEQISVGIFDHASMENQTMPMFQIPRRCFGQSSSKDSLNLFSLKLPSDQDGCEIAGWKLLGNCRKYTIEIKSQYFSAWTGPPSVWTVFTSKEWNVQFASHFLKDTWSCSSSEHFHCIRTSGYTSHGSYDSACYHIYDFCNLNCEGVVEKQICTRSSNCQNDDHRCNDRCLPKENVCDGKFDCLDGSDETDCEFCYELTGTSGHLTSRLDYSSLGTIHPSRPVIRAGFTNVLITVPANRTIWLAFNKFLTKDEVQVYDGPFSTYPLLGSLPPGSSTPPSLRSSSNSLYIRYPNYLSDKLGIEAYYFSMQSQGQPFRRGCDGYINGKGVVRVTFANQTKSHEMLTHCSWYIEARNEHETLLLKTSRVESKKSTLPAIDTNAELFGDWNRSKKLSLPESWSDKSSKSAVLYSSGSKLLLELPVRSLYLSSLILPEITNFSIQVHSLSSSSCTFELTGSSGTIKSPLYPNSYPHLSDCRWKIVTPAGTKIRLLFALFETQEERDYVFVYDGPDLDAPVLREASGTLSTPFLVNSSKNELLLRFVSDEEEALSGFLIVFNAD